MASQAIAINIQNPSEPQTGEGLRQLLFDLGVEPSLTVNEAAAVLRWSYWKARRYLPSPVRSEVFLPDCLYLRRTDFSVAADQGNSECQRSGGDDPVGQIRHFDSLDEL
jgi:hypothetical protein